ncbi:protein kinase domain-containing protein [Scytonema sp. NUACC26]|uniref:protein kinase domain-containing protein n=1 Tax=Scytonema sp. NUACC26 TaxID=3140176 RepID=UPI0034DC9F24
MSNIICPACSTPNSSSNLKCVACGEELSLTSKKTQEVSSPNYLSPGTFLKYKQYKIEKTLGEGAFGITYKGIDLVNNSRSVAIKELWPNRGARQGSKVIWPFSVPPKERQVQIQKFKDEAQYLQLLTQSKHPSIVKVFDFFEENNTIYIVMDFINGKTLYKILQEEGPLPESRITKYFKQLAYALQKIHDADLLHRDIKPENIIINSEDRAVLIDFGAAREFLAGRSKNMTRIWTPGYAPPEQHLHRAIRHPSADIYSLCASMYELLTGKTPADALERMNSGKDPLIPLRQLAPQIRPLMEKIILTGMKMKSEERFQNANHLIEALKGNFISPLLIKARELVKQGKLSEAIKVYEQCLIDEPDNGKAMVEQAIVLVHLGDPRAETVTLEAIKLQPNDGRLYGILGLLNCRRSDWSEAVQQLRYATNLVQDRSWIWANFGWALAKWGDWKQAEMAIDEALRLDKNSAFALGIKAWIAVNQQHWNSAILPAKQAIEKSKQPNFKNASALQAWVYPCLLIALERTVSKPNFELDRYLQEYIAQLPDSSFAYGFKGWLQSSQGQWNQALAEFNQAQAVSKPKVPAWVLLNLGICHENSKNTPAAIQIYKEFNQINPQNDFVLFRLGTLLGQEAQRLGQPELWSKALSCLEQAVQIRPDRAEAYHNLGWVLHQIKNNNGLNNNYVKLLAAYRRAVQLYEQQNQQNPTKLAQRIKHAFQLIGVPI